MLVNPMIFSQGGGDSPVVTSGLVIREKSDGTLNEPKAFNFQNDVTVSSASGFTAEICGIITGIPTGQTGFGYLIQVPSDSVSNSLVIDVSSNSGDIPSGGDFGLKVQPDGNDYGSTAVLSYDELYTITVTPNENDSTKYDVYVNGVYNDTVSARSINRTGNRLGLFRRAGTGTSSDRTVNGVWKEFRFYNRVLSSAEIAQNYASDVVNYM